MNFLADESAERQIVARLRADGHRVWSVAEMDPSIPDDLVLDLANREAALLITSDKDFGELVIRQRRIATGVILVRLAGLSPELKAQIVGDTFTNHANELQGSLTVIAPGQIRIRRLVV